MTGQKRRELWIDEFSDNRYGHVYKYEKKPRGDSLNKYLHVTELFLGDLVLSREQTQKLREAIKMWATNDFRADLCMEALRILNDAQNENIKFPEGVA